MFTQSPRPIRSVLVANRGEIAMRVLRTCKHLGLRGIAVYSDADANALHVRTADAATRIGPAPARESYLDIGAIIAAAQRMEADAIHPGYGFLSENAEFARACDAAGLIFIGPSAEAVASMGSKISSKRIAEATGVPTVPGYHGNAQDEATLLSEAKRIGFPVLIKASAGGGGRGMRLVEHAADFAAALDAARKEAQSAFGDASILLEKFIRNPRHLEVQLAGDRQGNLVHLFERDCSVQRNNQKVLEEAPAPNLPEIVRQRLFDAALKLGRKIGYDSAGTVEFIMEAGDDQPYFLEMNTRLQVEHPVTEAITGIDLVEWQIRAAAGEALPLQQAQIRQSGHAIEARITAERVDMGFQPVTGRLECVVAPRDLRFDTGVADGAEISPYYDSMIAKLVAAGRNRGSCLARLEAGLNELTLLGLSSNQLFLRDAVRHPLFVEGRATTRFIETAFPGGWKIDAGELRLLRAAATAAWLVKEPSATELENWTNPWLRQRPVRVTASARAARATVMLNDEYGTAEIELRYGRDGVEAMMDGEIIRLGPVARSGGSLAITPESVAETLPVSSDGGRICITRHGLAISADLVLKSEAQRASDADARSGNRVDAPLHGLITQIHVVVGDRVEAGMAVVQMEAMKLVHTLPAPRAGHVTGIRQAVGDIVPAGTTLIEIDVIEEKEIS
ncbi:biotin carboxylase N-terminal domain-containing protein [Ferrovibrio sp.]|uniref:ATP-binding protein n=1 Tax=Ferrovibrio sp. TaxID=1917215 RepID=UPI000CBBC6AE|nr:biotin carboxylase N-terminal domain-containing protein [Ferrovibrio sp.]PJI40928.1 MAG: 3-methylcrotonyl-CoA carboxylase [Ferrovibrio sp.]